MKVVILEDEAPARRLLVGMLSDLAPTVRVEAELESLADAREYFGRPGQARVDLVISDIRLSDGNALSLFEEGVVEAPVIFVTAYDTWITQAFAHLSVDYLLKPLERDALARALAKVQRLERVFSRNAATEAAALITRRPRERILVRHRAEMRALRVDDIAYFRADDKLTLAVDRDGNELIVERTLGQLERDLEGAPFFRVNRAYLVHASGVASFRSGGRGRIALTLRPPAPDEVIVSQDNAAAFRDFLDR